MILPRTARAFRLALLIAVALLALGGLLLIEASASTSHDLRSSSAVLAASSSSSISSLSDAEVAAILSKSSFGSLGRDEAKRLGAAIVPRSILEEMIPEEYAASFFPSASETLAMLARDRDVDDYLENASEKGAAGAYYQAVVDLAPSMKPLRSNYEMFFAGVYGSLLEMGRLKVPTQAYADSRLYENGVTLPRLSSKPRERDYDYSHTFALDIFLKDVETLPFSTLEKGPVVFSLTNAIVIATDSSWMGGEDLATYHSGGITPKAGNGAILYSPENHKYYLYFHLFDVLVSPGETIPRGYPIGHGGNTGTNARKPGHGEHLHLEIYDAAASRFLKNFEIADIVF